MDGPIPMRHLYEAKIKNMGNAGRNGGEYYTPRPLIRAIIQVVNPKIGETIYDGALGSAGFLCEAYDYMVNGSNRIYGKHEAHHESHSSHKSIRLNETEVLGEGRPLNHEWTQTDTN